MTQVPSNRNANTNSPHREANKTMQNSTILTMQNTIHTVSDHTNTQRLCKTKEQMKPPPHNYTHTHTPLNKHYMNKNRILPSYCSLPGNDTVDTKYEDGGKTVLPTLGL